MNYIKLAITDFKNHIKTMYYLFIKGLFLPYLIFFLIWTVVISPKLFLFFGNNISNKKNYQNGDFIKEYSFNLERTRKKLIADTLYTANFKSELANLINQSETLISSYSILQTEFVKKNAELSKFLNKKIRHSYSDATFITLFSYIQDFPNEIINSKNKILLLFNSFLGLILFGFIVSYIFFVYQKSLEDIRKNIEKISKKT